MQSKHSPVWVVMHYSYCKYNHIVELKKTRRPDLLFSTSCLTQHIRIHTHVFQYDIYSFLFTSVQLVMVLNKSLIMVMQFFSSMGCSEVKFMNTVIIGRRWVLKSIAGKCSTLQEIVTKESDLVEKIAEV